MADEWHFTTRDGREGRIAHARQSDAVDMHSNFCSVVEEGLWLPTMHPSSRISDWAEWITRIYRTREFLLVAKVEDEYAGHLSLQPEEWAASQHVARLGIIIKDGFRLNGVGRALMLAAEEVAKKSDYEKIVLSTFVDNEIAKTLYLSIDYQIVGRRKGQFKMPKGYIDEILMEKTL